MIPPKIAIINDLSGYGRCSLTVALPIISAMKIQACPIPTSIFSNHTGFSQWHCFDFTAELPSYLEKWEQLMISFDGCYCGYLGSSEQIDIIHHYLTKHGKCIPLILIDPVLGDHGKTYSRISPLHCNKMKELLQFATIITPNLTEACILANIDYALVLSNPLLYVPQLLDTLHDLGPKQIVITGILLEEHYLNFVSDKKGSYDIQKTPVAGPPRSGTGDIFASIVASHCINGHSLLESTELASSFISLCIKDAQKNHIPHTHGVCFEKYLSQLIPPAL